jgi:hypothetical protein
MLLELELLHLLLLLCPLSLVLQLIYLLPSSQDDGASLLIRDIQAAMKTLVHADFQASLLLEV